jgi:hypothetical protein
MSTLPRPVVYYQSADTSSACAAIITATQTASGTASICAYLGGYWIELGERAQCDPATPTAGHWSEIPA